MALTRVEKERISDSRLKIQSAANSLSHLDRKKVPDYDEIQSCLENAEESLTGALRSESTTETPDKR